MRSDELERLLDRFYAGESSEQEEELLKKGLLEEEIPDSLSDERRLFRVLYDEVSREKEEACEAVPPGLEERLGRLIDEKEAEETHFFHRNRHRFGWRWTGSIAATLLLLVGIGYALLRYGGKDNPPPRDTFTDPQEAYEVLQATLMEVSANLNMGLEEMEETRKEMMQANQDVCKAISR